MFPFVMTSIVTLWNLQRHYKNKFDFLSFYSISSNLSHFINYQKYEYLIRSLILYLSIILEDYIYKVLDIYIKIIYTKLHL